MTHSTTAPATGTVLDRIVATRREAVAARKASLSENAIAMRARAADRPRGFVRQLQAFAAEGRLAVIAELKRASPSAGLIRAEFDPAQLAWAYQNGGAACLSVLTEPAYFQGRDEDLVEARAAVAVPVLRKDFLIDPWQVLESRALGADCILLIMAALDDTLAAEMGDAARRLGMDVLVEVHDEAELARALRLDAPLIGINNRNLKTLDVDVDTTARLAPMVPGDRMVVSESGLSHHQDLRRLSAIGVNSFLVGDSLMRQGDVAQALRTLLGG